MGEDDRFIRTLFDKFGDPPPDATDERTTNPASQPSISEGLADRHDVLFATYAGEKNCLTITVFRQLTQTQFTKEWSVQQPPDGTGFCDTDFGSAAVEATDGVVAGECPALQARKAE